MTRQELLKVLVDAQAHGRLVEIELSTGEYAYGKVTYLDDASVRIAGHSVEPGYLFWLQDITRFRTLKCGNWRKVGKK